MQLSFTWQQAVVAAGIFVASTLGTTALVAGFLVWIPADYFVSEPTITRPAARRTPGQLAKLVGKNALGAVLVIIGAILSIPGVPGQGLLTILVGLVLLDIPGKRKVELRIVRRAAVRGAINRLRRRFNRAELELKAEPPPTP